MSICDSVRKTELGPSPAARRYKGRAAPTAKIWVNPIRNDFCVNRHPTLDQPSRVWQNLGSIHTSERPINQANYLSHKELCDVNQALFRQGLCCFSNRNYSFFEEAYALNKLDLNLAGTANA